MARPLAEKDPSHKQLIPYVIMNCGGRYLTYVRGKRAGETRLVGNRSIGIGRDGPPGGSGAGERPNRMIFRGSRT